MGIYVIHVTLMKMNHTYEVALKKGVANMMEVNELNRLAIDGIDHFHYNLDTRCPCIEVLNKIDFIQEGDIIVFNSMSTKRQEN